MTAFVIHGLYGRRLCLLAGLVGLLAGCTIFSHNSDTTRSLSHSTEDQAGVLRNSHWRIEKIFLRTRPSRVTQPFLNSPRQTTSPETAAAMFSTAVWSSTRTAYQLGPLPEPEWPARTNSWHRKCTFTQQSMSRNNGRLTDKAGCILLTLAVQPCSVLRPPTDAPS